MENTRKANDEHVLQGNVLCWEYEIAVQIVFFGISVYLLMTLTV